jgi:hypothetical protein
MYKTHIDGTTPNSDDIFVFGSNLSGIHGAGAAKEAFMHFGAIWKRGIGLHGQSYAIPTKDQHIETLSLDVIQIYVQDFIRITFEHPKKNFFVTRIGCGLAGYEDWQIAPMFRGTPDNCNYPIQWIEYI